MSRRLVLLGLTALALFILKDAIFLGGAFYERDLISIYYPMAEAFVRTVAEGAWPLRDPSTGFGQLLLGTPDAEILYPPMWLHLVMVPDRAYAFFVFFHEVLAAAGAAALAWRFSRSSLGAFFAGAFWLASGPLQSFLTLWHHLAGAAWIPWVLFAFDRVMDRADRPATASLGAFFGMQILAGSADMCAISLSLAVLLLICRATDPATRARMGSQLRASLMALLLAAGLGAATWLSVGAIVGSTGRASMPESTRVYWSIHPLQSPEFFLPLNFGSMALSTDTRETMFGGREPFVESIFLGPLIVPLLLGALFAPGIPRSYRLFTAVSLALTGLAAFGDHTPVYGLLTTFNPAFKIFRYPSKLAIPISMIACVAAGAGLTQTVGALERRVARVTTLVMLSAYAAAWLWLAGVFTPTFLPPSVQMMTRDAIVQTHWLMAACVCSLVALFVSLIRVSASFTRLAAAVGTLAAVQAQAGLNPVVAPAALRYRPDHVDAVKTPLPSRLYVHDYAHFPLRARRLLGRESVYVASRAIGLATPLAHIVSVRSSMAPPTASAWGVEYAWDMDLRGLFDNALREFTLSIGGQDMEATPAFLRLLQVANVSHVAALHQKGFEQLELDTTVPTPLPEDLSIFRVPEYLPRAYAVNGVRVADSAESARLLVDPAFDPRKEVALDAGPAAAPTRDFSGTVTISSRRSDRIELDARLNQPGQVVLLEGFLPGWRATLDGVDVPVRRANALFLAASSPAGSHTIVFVYRPWTALAGATVTVLSAVMLTVFLLMSRAG